MTLAGEKKWQPITRDGSSSGGDGSLKREAIVKGGTKDLLSKNGLMFGKENHQQIHVFITSLVD